MHAEEAVNLELGYKRTVYAGLTVEAALFYSKIDNTILMVSNVKYDSMQRVWQSQLQNVGQSEYLGAEIGAESQLLSSLKAGANYTYIQRNNLSNPSLYFIEVPRHKLFGFLQYEITKKVQVQVNAEYNSKRYSTTYGTSTAGFALLNASASVHVWRLFSVEAGVNNFLDRNYALVEGYPEPGRNYFTNLTYRL